MEEAHNHYMSVAIQAAKEALALGNIPVGACIVLNDEVISEGFNQIDTAENDLKHAEMVAISKVTAVLFSHKRKATLYTTLEPCLMCLGAIINTGISNIIYGASDPYIGMKSNLVSGSYYGQKLQNMAGSVLEMECQTLLNQYVEKYQCRFHLYKEI